jgi:hypothetical protein
MTALFSSSYPLPQLISQAGIALDNANGCECNAIYGTYPLQCYSVSNSAPRLQKIGCEIRGTPAARGFPFATHRRNKE